MLCESDKYLSFYQMRLVCHIHKAAMKFLVRIKLVNSMLDTIIQQSGAETVK